MDSKRTGPVFKYGLAAGFALILIGGVSLSLSLTFAFLEILVVCAGLGIVLGAFGSTASVSIPTQAITLGGVAVIAVALFVILLDRLDNRYVLVSIGGDVKNAEVEFVGDQNYLGAFQSSLGTHDFVVFGNEIKRTQLRVHITLEDQTEFPFDCIKSLRHLRHHLATGKTIEWSFQLPREESGKPTIRDSEGKVIAEDVGGCTLQANALPDSSQLDRGWRLGSMFGFFSTAFAQPVDEVIGTALPQHVMDLESATSHVRRQARTDIAALGTSIVEPLLDQLSQDELSYRLRLGIIVSLTEMMRENKNRRKEIIDMIDVEDLERLVDAAADEDRTTRVYASEFLFDLGDPRAIPVALERIPSASVNGRYNVLFAVKGAVPYVPDLEQVGLITELDKLKSGDTPDTNELIESIARVAGQN